MKYIYIDESGDLGRKYSSSKYFVIGAIIVENPKYLNRIIKDARNRYKKYVCKNPEIKGNNTPNFIIKKILGKINNIDYEVFVIFLDKQNLFNIPNCYNNQELYDNLASKLARNILINSPTCIIVDKSKNKQQEIDNFNEKFLSNINNACNHNVTIRHANSIRYNGLQIVDLVVWSVFQSLEYDNFEFVDLIENIIISEVYKN